MDYAGCRVMWGLVLEEEGMSLVSGADFRLKRSTCCSRVTAVVRSDSMPAAVVAISVRFSWLREWIASRLALD